MFLTVYDKQVVYSSPQAETTLASTIMNRIFLLSIVTLLGLALLRADPRPGDVFREYVYQNRFHELDPASRRTDNVWLRADSGAERSLECWTLTKRSEQRFRSNTGAGTSAQRARHCG